MAPALGGRHKKKIDSNSFLLWLPPQVLLVGCALLMMGFMPFPDDKNQGQTPQQHQQRRATTGETGVSYPSRNNQRPRHLANATVDWDKIQRALENQQHLSPSSNAADHTNNNKQQNRTAAVVLLPPPPPLPKKRNGFVVLGMHRSGTSMLSGLLVTGMKYKTGGRLMSPSFDNEKGFFELIPLVLQNDLFLGTQHLGWANGVGRYDPKIALEFWERGLVAFEKGTKALTLLNNPQNVPYLNKDPRMCITLRTWLPLLDHEPAVLFTYRHPLEVAQSLKKRQNFGLKRGLLLWIAYNVRAVQNSADLCRVTTSNDAVLANPLEELRRVSMELTTRCGVPRPAGTLLQSDVDKFIDPNLLHNQRRNMEKEKKVLMDFDGCKAYEYVSDWNFGLTNYEQEKEVYLKAMKIYCDLNSGKAYKPDYEWPEKLD